MKFKIQSKPYDQYQTTTITATKIKPSQFFWGSDRHSLYLFSSTKGQLSS